MNELLKKAWDEVVSPLFRRPPERQVAALCYRKGKDGKQVLLVTSRDTGRWILPKGWHEEGLSAADAAAREAWEEAGVREGRVGDRPVGSFDYRKKLDNGAEAPVETDVFALKVRRLERDYPEAEERKRRWVSPEKAAEMVAEPGLQRILKDF